ncbi:protein-disulfide reductase DsbD domain-containing protein [Rhodomicrobium vannielii]|uniref:protein-disulfide reductase DsbD domain-containing protein n=1 Tax=Rhodomicrobium vannielii TaxID=1069 RepID=UPI001AECBB0B|nr:protein-disulfide reductase DsbD domain-containing protein [Rhodomicrobium vannielii]
MAGTILHFIAFAGPARAREDASAWAESGPSRARLIWAGRISFQERQVAAAGIEIALEPGWRTAWRSPEGGEPPTFDWGNSANLRLAEVLWPAPSRLSLAEGAAVAGYAQRVVFPVLIAPEREDLPVKLALGITYSVCSESCKPVTARLELEIGAAEEGGQSEAVRAALELVPRVQAQGVYCPHSFIAGARRTVDGRPALVIKTAFDERATKLELFAEAPDGHIVPPAIEQPHNARGRSHFILTFPDEKQAMALRGQLLRLTLASDLGSCETTWRVK